MRQREVSIKWKLLIYLTGFVLGIIVLLWIVQTVFLDDFYERIKRKNVVETAEYLESNIESDDIQLIIDEISIREEVSINILSRDGDTIFRSSRSHDSVVGKLPIAEMEDFYIEVLSSEDGILKSYSFEKPSLPRVALREPLKEGLKSIVYGELIEYDGDEVILVVDATVTPIGATVGTLRTQLVYVTGILVLAASALAILLSKKIAIPLMEINGAAKALARRDYRVVFGGGGYREVVELRDTLNSAVKELSKTEELQRELIANISHDLRTPLTMIIGYSEAMRDLPGENTPENVQVVIDEANRLNRLVSDVLDISKLQSGTETLKKSKVNLTELIRQTIDRCNKLVGKDGYTLDFCPEDEVWVEGDELKLSQVLYNLLGNAITHTGGDKVVKIDQSLKAMSVRISIEDSGVGITEDRIGDIWERYYKLDKSHKRATVGTGLGLSIVKSVIELHGGRFGVESEVGSGSKFWFELSVDGRPEADI